MEQRRYPRQALDAIKSWQYVVQEGGLEVLVKPIPETDEAGVMDPRLYASMAPLLTGVKGMLARRMLKSSAKKAANAHHPPHRCGG